ncbi:MAG TPA: endonuclease/exonuclease/phosphatase family protein [Burkholderiales bacterium]|nr:endonuclease/exonuclease/phosphatase family protein [Burkholderiales bacterium]
MKLAGVSSKQSAVAAPAAELSPVQTLHVATYNIHKGMSMFNRRLVIHELRDKLRVLNADVVFLQEVLGTHRRHAGRHGDWPAEPQYEFLADSVWHDFAYGRNAVYDAGHHGNAILSRFPITRWDNQDISAHRFEQRGLLHCEIGVPGWKEPLHCVCVHLALTSRGRSRQLERLRQRIERLVPPDAPLVIAGDFNDWRYKAPWELACPLNLHEVFELIQGQPARSFPAALPLFRLDRIYVRGFRVNRVRVHHGQSWRRISDHAALSTTLEMI